ncbi:MAG: AraC family transcriptional regulator [Rhodobacteraceae bacterium]|nr:AraC family transcriptional regulator [Paracoccaceae bacterium]
MASTPLTTQVSALLDESGVREGSVHHAESGMFFLRHNDATAQVAAVYQPLLCLVLQGAKEVGTSTRTLTVSNGQSLLVSHSLPVTSRITIASHNCPYIALVLPLDLELLRELAPNAPLRSAGALQDPFSISLYPADEDLEKALTRYIEQCEEEASRTVLAPITLQEIHARLLMGPHGDQLQKLLWHETTASRVFQATQHIQANLSTAIAIADLAKRAGMSNSAFFEHFKSITGTSPLQYQKDLRLLRARDALRSSNNKVSEVAFSVGYDSPAQFSREYARKFGISPKQDRATASAA